ncbi:MAG: sulfatase-like hydrolase/transferase, partial [Anaerolineae bacterium]
MPRPNILLIHSDQHRYDCLGVNGHPNVQTPHLDRLAREGVNFTSAY